MQVAQSLAVADERCDRDPCVVPTDGLAPIVQTFVSRYEAQHPLASAYDELASRTNGEHSRPVSPAMIRKVASRTYRTVELWAADAIASAAGRPDAFVNGELEIMGNPRVPRELRGQCCGGSLNGAVGPA